MLGHVTSVSSTYGGRTATLASSAAYEPLGPLKGLTFGNGLLARTFNQQYRLTAQTTGTVQDVPFTLDAAGNIDAIADGVNAGLSQEFAQDALHRVTTDALNRNYTGVSRWSCEALAGRYVAAMRSYGQAALANARRSCPNCE